MTIKKLLVYSAVILIGGMFTIKGFLLVNPVDEYGKTATFSDFIFGRDSFENQIQEKRDEAEEYKSSVITPVDNTVSTDLLAANEQIPASSFLPVYPAYGIRGDFGGGQGHTYSMWVENSSGQKSGFIQLNGEPHKLEEIPDSSAGLDPHCHRIPILTARI